MSPAVLALVMFIAVFALATWRNVHLGILMFPAACGVGVMVAGMPLREVVGGWYALYFWSRASSFGKPAFGRIDWSTVFVVGGVVTFVGVLQRMGAVGLLGHGATNVGAPLLAALVICMTAGLVSALASTTGVLAALVPMAVPLATSGAVSGRALISALSVCAAIVDISPFSTTGATLVASTPETERARVRTLAMRWGMSMVVVGPVAFVALLLILGA